MVTNSKQAYNLVKSHCKFFVIYAFAPSTVMAILPPPDSLQWVKYLGAALPRDLRQGDCREPAPVRCVQFTDRLIMAQNKVA